MTHASTVTPSAFTAADVMATRVPTVRLNASVAEAWKLLFSSGRTHLLVVDDGRCVGVLDDRCVALEWPSGAFESRRRAVASLLGSDAVTVPPDATVDTVARTMAGRAVDAVAVVAANGAPLGLVTCRDLVLLIARVGLAGSG